MQPISSDNPGCGRGAGLRTPRRRGLDPAHPSHLSRDSDRSRQGERYEAIIRAHGPVFLENLNTPNWPEVMSSESVDGDSHPIADVFAVLLDLVSELGWNASLIGALRNAVARLRGTANRDSAVPARIDRVLEMQVLLLKVLHGVEPRPALVPAHERRPRDRTGAVQFLLAIMAERSNYHTVRTPTPTAVSQQANSMFGPRSVGWAW